MQLLLFRHGPAAPRGRKWSDDRLRPLTAPGKAKSARAAKGLARLGLHPDLIVSSPFVRARQTAELLASAFRPKGLLELDEALAPGGNPLPLLGKLARKGLPLVAFVGHEPSLSRLAATLVSGRPTGAALDLRKAGGILIEVDSTGRRGGLLALLPPRVLRAIAGERLSTRGGKGNGE